MSLISSHSQAMENPISSNNHVQQSTTEEMIQRMKGNCIFNKYPAQLCIVDGNLSFSLAHKMIMSDQRGRKRSSYKRWLYDSDQSKPKVTKWREKKKHHLVMLKEINPGGLITASSLKK